MKLSKGQGRIALTFDSQRTSEIVSATTRDDQNGHIDFHQFGEMAVDGAVPSENDGDVGLLEERGPFSAGEALELGHRSRHVSRSEDGSGAHAEELDHKGTCQR